MNKPYTIKINQSTGTTRTIELAPGTDRPTVIEINTHANIELVDGKTGRAPQKVMARRVGKDLQVFFEDGKPDEPGEPDLILQGFYDKRDNHLVGLAEDDQIFEYVPTSGDDSAYVPLMEDGTGGVQVLSPNVPVPLEEAKESSYWWLGAVALAALLAANHETLRVPGTPTQRPGSYLDNVGAIQADKSTAPVTDDNTPGLHIPPLPNHATGAVLYVDGVLTPSAYDPVTGTLTPLTRLPDGPHTLGYGFSNARGTSASSPTLDLIIDTRAPAAPTVDRVEDKVGVVQGLVPDHGVTNDAMPTITGTAEPGSKVTLFDASHHVIGTAMTNTGGQWSFTPVTALPEGPVTLTAEATDAAGNTGPQSQPVFFVVDTIAPAIAAVHSLTDDVGLIAGQIVNGTITDDTRPTIAGKAEPLGTLTIYDGTTVLGTTRANASGNWSFTPDIALAEGMHSWTVTVTDEAGNTGLPTIPITFVVDITAPLKATVTSVFDDQGAGIGTLTSGIATLTDDARPAFSGTAEAKTTIVIRNGDTLIGTAPVDSAGHWTFTPAGPLLNGAAHITAAAMDTAGNVGPASEVFDFTLVAGGVPTAASITNVVGTVANVSPYGVTNNPTPTVEGTAHSGYTVTLYTETGVVLGTTKANANGQWAITTPTLANGAHSFTATFTDPATGAVGDATWPWQIVVDTVAPAVPTGLSLTETVGDIRSLISGAITDGPITDGATTEDPTPTFTGTAEAGGTVTIRDGLNTIGRALVDKTGRWTFTVPTRLVDGDHSYSATVTDRAGNVSEASENIRFTIDTADVAVSIDSVIDNVAAITGPLELDAFSDDPRPTVTGRAVPGGLVALRVDGIALPGATATADSTGQWSITLKNDLTQGLHLVTATVTTVATPTAAATESAPTAPFTLTIDTIAPPAPLIVSVTDDVGSIRGRVAPGVSSDDSTPTLRGTAEANSKITIVDGSTIGTTMADSLGNWTFTPDAPLNDGLHSITVTATDAAGNVFMPSAVRTVLVDTLAPAAAPIFTAVIDDQGAGTGNLTSGVATLTDDASPSISGTSEANGSVIIRDGGVWLGTAGVDATGHWTFTPLPLLNGVRRLTATAVDTAGNIGPTTLPFEFTLRAGGVPTAPGIDNVVGDVVGDIVTTGNVAPDGVTADPTPTVRGTALVGTVVTLYGETGTVLGSVATDADGRWAITTTTLTEGVHSFSAAASSVSGNTSARTGTYTVTVDTVSPKPATDTALSDDVGIPAGATTTTTAITSGQTTDDATPTYTGKAEPGTTVTVRDGLTLLGTALVDTAGNWAFTPATPLAEGLHSFTATVTDAAGHTSAASSRINFTVDTSAVVVAIDSVVDHIGSVAGPLVVGAFTNDPRPTVNGSAAPGALISLRVDDLAVVGATAITDSTGHWSITPGADLTPGLHLLSVTANTAATAAAAGIESAPTAPFTLTIDLLAPAAPVIVSSFDNVGLHQGSMAKGAPGDDTTPTLAGTAEAGSRITLLDAGQVIGYALADSTGRWSFTPVSPLNDGSHTITATATDAAGNLSPLSVSWVELVDTVRPATPVISRVADNVGIYTADLLTGATTDDITPTLFGTAEANSTVNIKDAGVVIGTTSASTSGAWSYMPTFLPGNSTHVITVTSTDAAGNESTPTSFTIVIDTVAPLAPVITASNDNWGIYQGDIPQGVPTNDVAPTLSGTAEANALLTVFEGATKLGTTMADADGKWSFTTPFLAGEGAHALTATATDAAGNASPPSAPWNLFLDTIPPYPPIIVSSNDDFGIYTGNIAAGYPTNDTTPLMSGTAEANSLIRLFEGEVQIGTTNATALGTWSFTPTLIGEGIHAIRATATDAAGNVSLPGRIWNVLIDTIPPIKPTITASVDDVLLYVGSIASGIPTNDATPAMSGDAEANSLVSIFDDGILLGTVNANADGHWTYTPKFTREGAHGIKVTATDAAGNASVLSDLWTVQLDTIAPIKPTITASVDDVALYTGNIASGTLTNDATPAMAGDAEANSLVTVFENGLLIATVKANESGHWAYTPSLAGQGIHTIKITATDAAGNTSFSSNDWNVNLDTIAPAFTTNAATSADENTAAGTVIYTAGSTDASSVTYAITGGVDASRFTINAATGAVSLNFSPDYENPVDSGSNNVYEYTITATDAAGNQTSQNATFTVKDVFETPLNPSLNLILTGSQPGLNWTVDGGLQFTGRPGGNGFFIASNSSAPGGLFGASTNPTNLDGVLDLQGDIAGRLGNNIVAINEDLFTLINGRTYNFSIDASLSGSNATAGNLVWAIISATTTDIIETIDGARLTTGGPAADPAAHIVGGWSVFQTTFVNTGPTSQYRLAAIWTTGLSSASDMKLDRLFLGDYVPSNSATVPPIAIDLNHNGIISYSSVHVDITGIDQTRTSAWVAASDGVLIWDKYHDNKVHDSGQYAFAQYLDGAKTDLEGLKAFDSNGNGKLDGDDAIWHEMRIWQDLNENGLSDASEVKSLADWGINSIDLNSDGVTSNPFEGVHEAGKTSATLKDGRKMAIADVAFDTVTVNHGNVVAHPFILDLNHDGKISYDKSLIDLNGKGIKELTAWAANEDGVLVWDKNHDGQVHDSSQYSFGPLAGASTGMQGLKIFDTNGDDKLDKQDVLWNELGVWQIDAGQSGGPGTIKTLAQMGIESISLYSDGMTRTPAQGVTETGRATAWLSSGQTMLVADAALSRISTDYVDPLSYLDQTLVHAVV